MSGSPSASEISGSDVSHEVQQSAAAGDAASLDERTYDVIRQRLANHTGELQHRLDGLNAERRRVFGTVQTELIGTRRVSTSHNCIARDLLAVGDYLIVGCDVHLGLKTEVAVNDVFAVYRHRSGRPSEDGETNSDSDDLSPIAAESLLGTKEELSEPNAHSFEKDFRDLYRYYRHTQFARFARRGPYLFFVFSTGPSPDEIKVFKWMVEGSDNQIALHYVDNRSDEEFRLPPQHDFEWTRATRDDHHYGQHPHVSVLDRVFVETIGGDLTIKVENNTDSGEGIYAEPVDDPDQTLDDGDIQYAAVGSSIVLKIRPYQEDHFRYIVFNEKLQTALRLDSIHNACVSLPDGHGLIFPEGFYLQSGEYRTFEHSLPEAVYERTVLAPNGEDCMYVFYNQQSGRYVLLQYNLIEQQVRPPIVCGGWTLFDDGSLLVFKRGESAQKHHPVQFWKTPYVHEDRTIAAEGDTFLHKIGHREVVRGMAQCQDLLNLARRDDTYSDLYADLSKQAGDLLDACFWLDREEVGQLAEPIRNIRSAAATAINEYERFISARQAATDRIRTATNRTHQLLAELDRRDLQNVNDFVESMKQLRELRGNLLSLQDLPYADSAAAEELETQVAERSAQLAQDCVQFLLRQDALQTFEQQIDDCRQRAADVTTTTAGRNLQEQLVSVTNDLELLIDIVSDLEVADPTERTSIIDAISVVFSSLNAVRAVLNRTIQQLGEQEHAAEFASQNKLLDQAIASYLEICDEPEKCQSFLTKTVVQLEQLEARFGEFDDYRSRLADKRDEVYSLFETRRLQLVEYRGRRINAIAQSADRVLAGIRSRTQRLKSLDEINGYFASDLMIEKVRAAIVRLNDFDDPVRADGLQTQLQTLHDEAVRQLRDREELFVDGEPVLQFGRHRFSVNTHPVELTTLRRDNGMCLHISGTELFRPLTQLEEFRDQWDQQLGSENEAVYRGEYLAWVLYQRQQADDAGRHENTATLDDVSTAADEELQQIVRSEMASRHSEGYTRGVHDRDAAQVLRQLLLMKRSLGLLRYEPDARALASAWWNFLASKSTKAEITAQLCGAGAIADTFRRQPRRNQHIRLLHDHLSGVAPQVLCASASPSSAEDRPLPIQAAAEYLFEELKSDGTFAISQTARQLADQFREHLNQIDRAAGFQASIDRVQDDPVRCLNLLSDWISAFAAEAADDVDSNYIHEAAIALMPSWSDEPSVHEGRAIANLQNFYGEHALVRDGTYRLDFHDFVRRLSVFDRVTVPRFSAFMSRKQELVQQAKIDLRLEELQPKVLTSFVRNRLVNDVYLPLIGDNLARQIGTAADTRRSEQSGLLLLVSPPGYGKTTLMEYVAHRLGLIFVKINGPALGHAVLSLDPSEAPDAASREEVEKLNFAFELGDNVMIYVDDIQHTSAEFLQKFISLCDGQRKIEGVCNGQSRTYDLRGRKVAVVMAGNPYTESGHRFQVPDMLANRADIHNLGEVCGSANDAFELSYLENAVAANPTLAALSNAERGDVESVIRLAHGEPREAVSFSGDYPLQQLDDFVVTMRKLIIARDILLKVNREYIRSAGQNDDDRTEPPFRLQGSYRNMNRLAQQIVPVMNDEELTELIVSHYENDAQTLTNGTEANLLKFRELMGLLSDQDANRWSEIKRTFQQNVRLRGLQGDAQAVQVVACLTQLSDELNRIGKAVINGSEQWVQTAQSLAAASGEHAQSSMSLGGLESFMETVRPVLEGLQTELSGIRDAIKSQQLLAAEPAGEQSSPTIDARSGKGDFVLNGQTKQDVKPEPSPAPLVEASGSDSQAAENADDRAERRSWNGQPLTVVNKIPSTMVAVLKQQFRLMQAWLQPIHAATEEQRQQMSVLQQQLHECTSSYETLIERIEADR